MGVLDNGATISCSLCDLGKYGKTAGICSSCAGGTFQDTKGEPSCQECPVNTYLSEEGKSSKADCQQCPSERSTGSSKGNTNASACLCKRTDYYQDENSECLECPVGANCSAHDGITLKELTALPGYWRASAEKPIFTDCSLAFSSSMTPKEDAITRCPGGTTALETFNADTQCRTAYGGPCTSLLLFCTGSAFTYCFCLNSHLNSFFLCFFLSLFFSLFLSRSRLLLLLLLLLLLPFTQIEACMSCVSKEYTVSGGECVLCPGGASVGGAMGTVSGIMVVLFVIFAFIFMRARREDENVLGKKKRKRGCCGGISVQHIGAAVHSVNHGSVHLPGSSHAKHKPKKKAKMTTEERLENRRGHTAAKRMVTDQMLVGRMQGSGGAAGSSGAFRSDTQIVTDRIKILYGWMQIFTALTFTFDIQWPIQLKSFSLNLSFINLDLSEIMAGSACSLSLPFLDTMMVHAALPLMLLVTIFLARLPAYFLRRKHRKKQSAVQIKLCFALALILYPGACLNQ